jgi:two-component system, OmpR family, sensor kinase
MSAEALKTDAPAGGAAVLCSAEGVVERVIRDDLGAFPPACVGKPFPLSLERDSFKKGLDFIAEAKRSGAAFDYELSAPTAKGPLALHFAAAMSDGAITVVCERDRSKLYSALEDLADALAERLVREREQARSDALREKNSLEAISELNNELVDMQRELARKNARLQELSALKDRFVGMAAHDLRSPLTAISMYTDFMQNSVEELPVERRQEYLGIIKNSVDFMVGLIDSLLDIADMESGELRIERQKLNMALLARNYAERMQPLAEARGISLAFESAELGSFFADPIRIEQLLANLVGNGLKYVPRGGRVRLSLAKEGEGALIVVEDNGPGIAPEEQARLFGYFARGSVKSPHGEKSTGLGLAICKRIVEGHGGTITLTSEASVGTSVRVWLPAEGR